MNNKILGFTIFIILAMSIVYAVEFSPQGHMNLKDRYGLYNATFINTTDLLVSGTTNITGTVTVTANTVTAPASACSTYHAITAHVGNLSNATCTDSWVNIDGDTMTGNLNIDGNITIEGFVYNNGWVSREPFLDENTANVANKPSLISRGLFMGYSLPEYATGEELFFRTRVPHRWDGTTNPHFVAITSISAAEDVGDKYKFNLSWVSEDIENIIPDNTIETVVVEVTVANGSAYYAEIMDFELDAITLVAGQNLQARLRRVTASSSSVDNEIVIWHWDMRWLFEKLGTNTTHGYGG